MSMGRSFMNNLPPSGFAPQYTLRERWRMLLLTLLWAVPLLLLTTKIFLPWFDAVVPLAHCHEYLGINGLTLVIYGVLVGLPVSLVVVVLLLEGRRSWRTWRLGQFPLPGEKVLRPTRYVYGRRARLRPALFFMVVLLVCGLSAQGWVWAGNLLPKLTPDLSVCFSGIAR